MQIMYGLAGERRSAERTLPWLPGYEAIHAGAYRQRSVRSNCSSTYLGEVADALHARPVRAHLAAKQAAWRLECALAGHLEQVWSLPDEGIWEVRGPRRCFTHSRVMAWVAFDRAVKTMEAFGLPGPLERWATLWDHIHEEVCRCAFDPALGSFVQSYGGPRTRCEPSADAARGFSTRK